MSDRSEIARRVIALATRQHGVVARPQLLGLGMTDNSIASHLRSRRLHRVHPGVYSVGHASLSPLGVLMAAHLAGGPTSAISHLTAAAEWRMTRIHPSSVDLLVPRNHRGGLDGVQVRRTRDLPGWQTTRRNGIRRTNVSRTIVDLTDVLTEWQLTHVLNEASRRSLLRLTKLEQLVELLHGRHGLRRVRRAIAMHLAGSAGTKSDLEDLCLQLILRAGIEEPIVNVEVAVDGRSWELDFHWPRHRVNVEVDGGSGHLVPFRSAKDAVRDAALEASGWVVLRFAGDQVRYGGDVVVDEIRSTLAAR